MTQTNYTGNHTQKALQYLFICNFAQINSAPVTGRNGHPKHQFTPASTMKRKVCIVTGTRAEWGLLSDIAHELSLRDDVELQIIATNMHLEQAYGHTIDEIIAAGFIVNATVPMHADSDTASDTVKAMSTCMVGMADAFCKLQPDIVVILGDRTEMLAVATAATVMRIPIVHLHGGEISEGAIDDSIRHAITKLSALHLTATEDYRRRVIQLGECPDHVINTGAIGVYNALHTPIMTKEELQQSIGMTFDTDTLLVTYHPATLDDVSPATRAHDLLDALSRFPHVKILFTYPNNDPAGRVIIEQILSYRDAAPERVCVVPSLGKTRYLSALRYVSAVVGNSSSGIIEVPSMHIPTVDIGIRQRGRIAAQSVIHCGDSCDEISSAIALALSPQGRDMALHADNPYYRPDTLRLIVEAIATTPISSLTAKKFHDIAQ